MKNFIFILALYLTVLQAIPCVDAGEHACSNPVQTTSGHNQHTHDQADACTPFCSCSCCSITVMVTVFDFSGKPEKIEVHPVARHHRNFNTSYFVSFWQPPEVA